MEETKNSFIVSITSSFIGAFRYLTISFWIGADSWSRPYHVELWVLCNLFLSAASYFLFVSTSASDASDGLGLFIFLFFACSRIVDIVTYHMKLILTSPISFTSYRRSVVYLELVFWFSSIYVALSYLGLIVINGPKPISVLRETFALMVSNDFSIFAMHPNYAVPWIAVTSNSFVGLFMTTVVVARIIALLPPADTSDHEEKLKHRSL